MSSSLALPPTGRRRTAVLGAVVALALTGCGLRLETPPPQAPEPDLTEELRQETAAAAARLGATADVLAPEMSGGEDAAEAVRAAGLDAQEHLDALGGVWVAWPDGAPEGSQEPAPAPTQALTDVDAAGLVELLVTEATRAREAAVEAPGGDLAALLGSIAIARQLRAEELAAATGAELPGPEEDEEPVSAPLAPEALAARGADGPTLLVLDQTRFVYETAAARAAGETREEAAERSAHLQALVDVAIAEGAPDERQSLYSPEAEAGEDMDPDAAAVVAAETALAQHLLFSLGRAEPELRPELLAAATDAVQRAADWGAEASPLPGLPGS